MRRLPRGEVELRFDSPTGPWRGFRRKERIDVAELLKAVADHHDNPPPLPPGFVFIEPRGEDAWIVEAAEGPVWLLRHPPVRGLLARPASERIARNTQSLRSLGLDVPRVLGWLSGAKSRPSWSVTEHLGGPSLRALLEAGILHDPGERRRIGCLSAALLGRWHASGWVHGAMSPDRILVSEDRVRFVGLERARPSKRTKDQRLDLCPLIGELDARERTRFLLVYLGRRPDRRAMAERWSAWLANDVMSVAV